MNNGSFTFRIRTQFSFFVDDRTLSRILSGIANRGINITAYLQTKLFEIDRESNSDWEVHDNIVRLVVGSPDSERSSDLRGVREVLHSLGVNFQEKEVIQVLDIEPGVPGVINSIFGALRNKVIVNAIYYGEETRLYVDASDTGKALRILSRKFRSNRDQSSMVKKRNSFRSLNNG